MKKQTSIPSQNQPGQTLMHAARNLLAGAIYPPSKAVSPTPFWELAKRIDLHLQYTPNDSTITPLLTFMSNLFSTPTFDQPVVFTGKDAFLNATYPLIRFPILLSLIDEGSVENAISTIEKTEQGKQLLRDLDDIFDINDPKKVSKFIATDTDSSGWKKRVEDQYANVKKQALLYISSQIKDQNEPDFSKWLSRLTTKLSEMTACETNLLNEYSRLQVDIAQNLSDDDLPFDLRVQCRLATMVLEPKLLSVQSEFFKYTKSISLDHHLLYYSQQLVSKELAGVDLPSDKYGLDDSIRNFIEISRFKNRLISEVKSSLLYSEIVSVIAQDSQGISHYFGKHLTKLPVIQSHFSQLGCAPDEDGTGLTEAQWKELIPSAIFQALLHSKTIEFRLPSPPDDLGGTLATAMMHCSLKDLTELTGLNPYDFYKFIEGQRNVIDAVMASGCTWLAQCHIEQGQINRKILFETVDSLMKNESPEKFSDNRNVVRSRLSETDLDSVIKASQLLTACCSLIEEREVFDHSRRLTFSAISTRNKEKLILYYVSRLLENRNNWSFKVTELLKQQRDRSQRILSGGSQWQELFRLLAPLVSELKVGLIIFCAWLIYQLLNSPKGTHSQQSSGLS